MALLESSIAKLFKTHEKATNCIYSSSVITTTLKHVF